MVNWINEAGESLFLRMIFPYSCSINLATIKLPGFCDDEMGKQHSTRRDINNLLK